MAEATVVARAEKKIDRLCDLVGCSESGAAWVKQTLDVFNDEERTKVGYPDVIIGKSVIQKIPVGGTYTVGASAEDVHIFMDSVDTPLFLYENTAYVVDGSMLANNFLCDAASGIGASRRGGVCLRHGPPGTDLTETTAINFGGASSPVALDQNYLVGGGCRVIGKGFEVVNATPQLTVGGSVRCYRATGVVPYDDADTYVLRSPTTPLTNTNSVEGRGLQAVPVNISQVESYTDYTFWNAKEGAMVVAVPSAQTNEPTSEFATLYNAGQSVATPAKYWINAWGTGLTIPRTEQNRTMQSPFFLCGAYFTGLPAGSILDVRAFYIVERFVSSSQKDLVILANPSPSFDPVAIELMARTAQRMPVATRVKNNATGDWLKTIADIAGAFGVPGMPLVKGAVDLFQGGMKAYDNYQRYSQVQDNPNARKMIDNITRENKFVSKNQKRQRKGKGELSRDQFESKKNASKQRKKAAKESNAGKASGGTK